jgi:hypothetical protein
MIANLLTPFQFEFLGQSLNRRRGNLLRFFPKLAVKVGIVVRIHATLENLRVRGAIKKPRCNTQRADAITAGPCNTDFVGLPIHAIGPASATRERRAF